MDQKTNTTPVTPLSKWQIEAHQQIELLAELRSEALALDSTFDRVLEPDRGVLAKGDEEKRDRSDSEAIEYLRESNEIIRGIISIVRSIRSRSQI